MATLLHHYQRDLDSDISGVKNTFSSWDQCMTKAYCKWPTIIGIIVGCIIAFSIIWCLVRCLCCGVEMCCGCLSCLSCCGSCCNNSRNRNRGYQQPEPTPQLQPYAQYQSAPPPMYGMPQQQQQQYQQPQYAQYGQKSAGYNEDALPNMPSWNTSRTTHTPDVEMDHLNQASAPMFPQTTQQSYNSGDLGTMGGPQQHMDSYGQQDYYTYNHGDSAPAMAYADPYAGYGRAPAQQQMGYIPSSQSYETSVAPPPSYRTAAPSVDAPVIARRPVGGSWRDI